MKKLAILGATGSIGASTLSVCSANPELYQISLLAAASNSDKMFQLCQKYVPNYVFMSEQKARAALAEKLKQAISDLNQSSEIFASRRMDASIRSVMAGHNINEFSE